MSPRRRTHEQKMAALGYEKVSCDGYVKPTEPTICYGEPADLAALGVPGMLCGCRRHAPHLHKPSPAVDGILCKVPQEKPAFARMEPIKETVEKVAKAAAKGGDRVDG